MALDMLIVTVSVLLAGYIILIQFFLVEKASHHKRLHNIPLRIHVNGIRGKSSVTRLIGGVLREAGYRTFTKTTGSSARLIYPDGKDRMIKRKSPNIKEQVDIVEKISRHKPDALVIECMAISPSLQKVSESEMIQANIGVLTNVRMDHQDKMGWTLEEIASSLCEFMPTGGQLVCGEQNPKLIKVVKKRARENNTKVTVVNSRLTRRDKEQLKRLSYIEHEENVKMALSVAALLNIERSDAIRGVLKTMPDPGVLRIYRKRMKNKTVRFVNAHAANDRESVLIIYNTLKKRGIMGKNTKKIAVLYNRKDRPERVDIFADIVTKDIRFDEIILLGHYRNQAEKKLISNGFSEKRIHKLARENLGSLLRLFNKISGKETMIIGMVNIHGEIVEDYINYFHSNNGGDKIVL